MITDEFRKNLRSFAVDIEKRSKIARDAHFLEARKWDRNARRLGILVVVSGVISGGVGIFTDNATIAAAFGLVAGLLGAVNAFFKPNEEVENHKRAGDDWSKLRDQATEFHKLKLEHSDANEQELQREFDEILKEKKRVTDESPIIPSWAYEEAKKGFERTKETPGQAA